MTQCAGRRGFGIWLMEGDDIGLPTTVRMRELKCCLSIYDLIRTLSAAKY